MYQFIFMDYYKWDPEKIKAERGIRFEQVVMRIERGEILDLVVHPNQEKYPDQQIIIVAINEYAYFVPFVASPKGRFSKTIIPSRKATRDYLGGQMSKRRRGAFPETVVRPVAGSNPGKTLRRQYRTDGAARMKGR